MSKIYLYSPLGTIPKNFKMFPEPVLYPEKPKYNNQIVISLSPVDTPNPNLILCFPENILEKIEALNLGLTKK